MRISLFSLSHVIMYRIFWGLGQSKELFITLSLRKPMWVSYGGPESPTLCILRICANGQACCKLEKYLHQFDNVCTVKKKSQDVQINKFTFSPTVQHNSYDSDRKCDPMRSGPCSIPACGPLRLIISCLCHSNSQN